jgi:hypothetical protein
MRMDVFIKKNKEAIDHAIRVRSPNNRLNQRERVEWIRNEEALYLWAKRCGVRV